MMKLRQSIIPFQPAAAVFLVFLFALLFASPFDSGAQAKNPKILYFNSDNAENPWWRMSSDILEAACKNLGMDCSTVYVNRNYALMVGEFRKAAAGQNRPDAVVFQNLRGNALAMLEIAEEYGVPAFIFNAGLSDEQTSKYGGPREKFKYWIGQMLPDDRMAGKNLALYLFKEAKRLGMADSEGKVNFIAINGTPSDIAAIERSAGLDLAAKEEPGIVVHQSAPGYWEEKQGKTVFLGLMKSYPTAKVVWAANDPMALGAIEGMEELHLLPGKDMLIGSFDWIPEALEQVRKGYLFTTAGGHFMETGWVAVLLHDYFHGWDFASEATTFHSGMELISRSIIDDYLTYFKREYFGKIDFGQFTKVANPGVKKYNFSFATVLRNVKQR